MNDGKSFVALAQTLGTQTTSKAAMRSAVSRAYYGAYNYARHVLRQLGYSRIANGRSHGDVWNYFQNSGDVNAVNAGQMLADLDAARVSADYHLNKSQYEGQKNVQWSIATAHSILNEFDNCLATSAKRVTVAQGMGKYEQVLRGGAPTPPTSQSQGNHI